MDESTKHVVFCAVAALLSLSLAACRGIAGYTPAPRDLALSQGDQRADRRTTDLRTLPDLADAGFDVAADGDPGCAQSGVSSLLRFTFDDPLGTGDTLMSSGTVVRPGQLHGGGWSLEPGGACGKALVLKPTTAGPSYMQVSHETFFDLIEGAVELWLRFDRDPGNVEGVFSRDARYQQESGHLTLVRRPAGHLAARLQGLGVVQGAACMGASAFTKGQWHHVVVDFGGAGELALYVDGKRADYEQADQNWPCGDTSSTLGLGIEGNHNPWVLGAHSFSSAEGQAGAEDQLVGAIDEFRLYDHRLHP